MQNCEGCGRDCRGRLCHTCSGKKRFNAAGKGRGEKNTRRSDSDYDTVDQSLRNDDDGWPYPDRDATEILGGLI